MKKTSISIAVSVILCVWGQAVLAQNTNINGQLRVSGFISGSAELYISKTATFYDKVQIGDANNHPGLFTNGPTWLGTSDLHQPVNLFGTLSVSDNTTLGATDVNGNMMLHRDLFVDGTAWFGNTNIGNTTNPRFMSVYGQTVLNGALFVGSSSAQQQTSLNGSVFIGTPEKHGLLNVDGDVLLHNNLTIDGSLGKTDVNGNMMLHKDVFVDGTSWLGTTNIGSTTQPRFMSVYGQTVLNGNTFIGSPQAPVQLNVDGGVYLHGSTQIGDATHQKPFDVYGFATLHNAVVMEEGLRIGTVDVSVTKWPQYKLWVQKGIVSEDYVIAPTSDWADFVFNEKYKLPSLKELEAYLKTNKHLPEIPAQAEVAKDGYSLRKINTVLLQKVEELTLYTIEQDKKFEVLAAEVAQLKEAIEKLKK